MYMDKVKAMYAIPCSFGYSSQVGDDYEDEDDMFFVTLSTRSEKEAITLATCVVGDRVTAMKSLVIITDGGDVYPF